MIGKQTHLITKRKPTMSYMGVDFHQDISYLTTWNEEGKKRLEVELRSRPEAIPAWARTLRPGDRGA
jgi:hypothetical protein